MTKKSTHPDHCPVAHLAFEVGALWDAFNGAQGDNDEVAKQIEEYRETLEFAASFKRATSLNGALFQVALLKMEAQDLFANLTEVQQKVLRDKMLRFDRLVESVSSVLMNSMSQADKATIDGVIRVYGGITDRPIEWLDDVRDLAAKGRRRAGGRP